MADKYLSIITNFGCHYSCPECIVRNNKLKMTPTGEYSSYAPLWQVLHNECNDCNWVSVSGGGDPLFSLVGASGMVAWLFRDVPTLLAQDRTAYQLL